jgi:2-C-methyl-D-erythritol 4-phosphate cytidylyltransferase
MDVLALVVVDEGAGTSERVAPDVFSPLAGIPVLVRSVRGLLASGVVDHVVVLVPAHRVASASGLLVGMPGTVEALDGGAGTAGPATRPVGGGPVGAGSAGGPPARSQPHPGRSAAVRRWLRRPDIAAFLAGAPDEGASSRPRAPAGVALLHDAARPLAPSALAVAVVDAVRAGHPAAVPALPLPDTLKTVDPRGVLTGTPDRSTLRVVQTPQAVRADLLPAVLATVGRVEHAYRALAGPAHLVAGDPLAFAVRTAWDAELAEMLVEVGP